MLIFPLFSSFSFVDLLMGRFCFDFYLTTSTISSMFEGFCLFPSRFLSFSFLMTSFSKPLMDSEAFTYYLYLKIVGFFA